MKVSSVLFVFVFVPFVVSTKWYVSPNGTDSFGNGSEEDPWLTLTFATTQATDGDIVFLLAGDYSGSENHPTVTANITYEGANATVLGLSSEPCFTAKGPFVNMSIAFMAIRNCSVAFDLLSGADLTLQGLLVENCPTIVRVDDDESPQRVQIGISNLNSANEVVSTTNQKKTGLVVVIEASRIVEGSLGRAKYVIISTFMSNVSITAIGGMTAATGYSYSSFLIDLDDEAQFTALNGYFSSSSMVVIGGKLTMVSSSMGNTDGTALILNGTDAFLSYMGFSQCGSKSENGGGIRLINNANLNTMNVGFSECVGLNGGGIYCEDSTFSFFGPYFDKNHARESGGDAQCVSCTSSAVYLYSADTNCMNDNFRYSALLRWRMMKSSQFSCEKEPQN